MNAPSDWIVRTRRFSGHFFRATGAHANRFGWGKCDAPRQASADGFALIDVLVGLALVGVISSLMIVFFGQARSMIRIGNATQMQMEVDAASRFLESAIASAEPLPLPRSAPEEPAYFQGDSTRLRFSGIQAVGFASSTLKEISVSMAEKAGADGTRDLLIVQRPRRGGATGNTPESQPVTLISDVASIGFDYLDGITGAWSSDWNATRRLPSAVRFRISVVRDGANYSSDGLARLTLAPQQPAN